MTTAEFSQDPSGNGDVLLKLDGKEMSINPESITGEILLAFNLNTGLSYILLSLLSPAEDQINPAILTAPEFDKVKGILKEVHHPKSSEDSTHSLSDAVSRALPLVLHAIGKGEVPPLRYDVDAYFPTRAILKRMGR